MINSTLGVTETHNGAAVLRTPRKIAGNVIHGPYWVHTPGVYEVSFRLALAGPRHRKNVVVAILDVVSEGGHLEHVRRDLVSESLSTDWAEIRLLFVVRDIRVMEYRVHTTGQESLLVDPQPSLRRISGILDEPPQGELAAMPGGLPAVAEDTRRILRHLEPQAMRDHGKIRLGRDNDGGYVCPDAFSGIDTAFSFGINDDISWDLDVAERGLTVYQFDHTVDDPAPSDTRMIFEKKRIATISDDACQALGDLVKQHDKGRDRPNIILKMDIENHEWDVIDATDEADLRRIMWITGEMHYFQGLVEPLHRAKVDRCLRKLARHFAVVHVHANVYGACVSIAEVVVPTVLELTFVNREHFALQPNQESFPGPLDQTCRPPHPDIFLGAFRF